MPPKPKPRPRPAGTRRAAGGPAHPLDAPEDAPAPTAVQEPPAPAAEEPPAPTSRPAEHKEPEPAPQEQAPAPPVQEPPAPEPAPQEQPPPAPAPEPPAPAVREQPEPTAPAARPEPVQQEQTPPTASRSLQVRRSTPPVGTLAPEWTTPPVGATPADVPRATDVLNQRVIKRKTLSASVPEALHLGLRLDQLRLACRIEHIPPADFVALAVDRFLRGDEPDRSLLDEPWCSFTGEGTPEQVPPAEQILDQRFIHREMLRAAVPRQLDLHYRLERFRLEQNIRHIPVGDVVALAVDRFLRLMDA